MGGYKLHQREKGKDPVITLFSTHIVENDVLLLTYYVDTIKKPQKKKAKGSLV